MCANARDDTPCLVGEMFVCVCVCKAATPNRPGCLRACGAYACVCVCMWQISQLHGDIAESPWGEVTGRKVGGEGCKTALAHDVDGYDGHYDSRSLACVHIQIYRKCVRVCVSPATLLRAADDGRRGSVAMCPHTRSVDAICAVLYVIHTRARKHALTHRTSSSRTHRQNPGRSATDAQAKDSVERRFLRGWPHTSPQCRTWRA